MIGVGVGVGVAQLARAAVVVPTAYLSVLTAAAWWSHLRRRRPSPVSDEPLLRFAVMVPAHDEEVVIGTTLAAMRRLAPGQHAVDVHVVADHCTDATVEIARSMGVHVFENVGGKRGKGAALQRAIDEVLDGSPNAPDVVVVVDADTTVDPGMIVALSRAFAAGADVVQGRYDVAEPGSSPAVALRWAAVALRHHVRPLGRTTLGASCGLFGNGMAFRAPVLSRQRWTSHLTEDLELQLRLLLENSTLVAYAPDAVVVAQMPTTLDASRTQHERWERGRIDLARRYVPQLIRLAGRDRRRRLVAIDSTLDLLVPPLSVLAAATTATSGVGALVAATRRRSVCRALLPVAALATHVLSGLVLARAPASVWRGLSHAPRLIVWKVQLFARMLVRPGAEGWARTERHERSG